MLDLLSRGEIFEWEPTLRAGELPSRKLYICRLLKDWVEADVVSSNRGTKQLSPASAMSEVFDQFCAGRPMTSDFTRLQPNWKGVCRLHTPHLRFFGWFVAKGTMVLTHAGWSDELHGPRLAGKKKIAKLMDKSVRRSNSLKLSIITGERYELL